MSGETDADGEDYRESIYSGGWCVGFNDVHDTASNDDKDAAQDIPEAVISNDR